MSSKLKKGENSVRIVGAATPSTTSVAKGEPNARILVNLLNPIRLHQTWNL